MINNDNFCSVKTNNPHLNNCGTHSAYENTMENTSKDVNIQNICKISFYCFILKLGSCYLFLYFPNL